MLRIFKALTWNWARGLWSSFGMKNKKLSFESCEPDLLTFIKSPSATPGHNEWLKSTPGASFTSCTQRLNVLESPTLSGSRVGVGKVRRTDWAVFERCRLKWECWDSALDDGILVLRSQLADGKESSDITCHISFRALHPIMDSFWSVRRLKIFFYESQTHWTKQIENPTQITLKWSTENWRTEL